MGNVKRVITDEKLPKRQHYYGVLWCDLCENLHIHLRNIRLDFSKKEWQEFVKHLVSVFNKVLEYKDYKENSGYQLMFKTPLKDIKPDSDYFSDRFRVEDEHDGSVHVHYRDVRLHMTREEYNQIARAMEPIE